MYSLVLCTCFFVLSCILPFSLCLQHTRQTSMPPAGFEHAIPASERLQTLALDRSTNRSGRDSTPGPSSPQGVAIPSELCRPTQYNAYYLKKIHVSSKTRSQTSSSARKANPPNHQVSTVLLLYCRLPLLTHDMKRIHLLHSGTASFRTSSAAKVKTVAL